MIFVEKDKQILLIGLDQPINYDLTNNSTTKNVTVMDMTD